MRRTLKLYAKNLRFLADRIEDGLPFSRITAYENEEEYFKVCSDLKYLRTAGIFEAFDTNGSMNCIFEVGFLAKYDLELLKKTQDSS